MRGKGSQWGGRAERGGMEKGGMRMGDEGWNAKGLEGEGTLQSMRWLQPLTLIVCVLECKQS